MMTEKLYLVRTGCGRRLERGLKLALQDLPAEELDAGQQEWLRRYEILNYCGMVDLFDEARPMFCADGETGEAP